MSPRRGFCETVVRRSGPRSAGQQLVPIAGSRGRAVTSLPCGAPTLGSETRAPSLTLRAGARSVPPCPAARGTTRARGALAEVADELRVPRASATGHGVGARTSVARASAHRAGRGSCATRSQQLPAELVVGDLGDQELVLANRAPKPRPDVVILAWVADLAEHAGIQYQSHGVGFSSSVL